MKWLDRLASEISAATQSDITSDQLYEQLVRFRDTCSDPILRASYPADMHHFKKSGNPQASTRDVILTFMDKYYHHVRLPLVREIADQFNAQTRSNRDNDYVAKAKSKERARRYAQGDSSRSSYWGMTFARMQEKYSGLYAMLRIDSKGDLQAEPFAIVPRAQDPTSVSMFWLCASDLRLGDILVNTYRLIGTTVCRSSDAIIEPAPVAFLRAPRFIREGQKLLVLGGFGLGWKDEDPLVLFGTRLAAVKLEASQKLDTEQEFVDVVASSQVQTALVRLRDSSVVTDSLVPRFLKSTKLDISATDARNAMQGLTPGLVTV